MEIFKTAVLAIVGVENKINFIFPMPSVPLKAYNGNKNSRFLFSPSGLLELALDPVIRQEKAGQQGVNIFVKLNFKLAKVYFLLLLFFVRCLQALFLKKLCYTSLQLEYSCSNVLGKHHEMYLTQN